MVHCMYVCNECYNVLTCLSECYQREREREKEKKKKEEKKNKKVMRDRKWCTHLEHQ